MSITPLDLKGYSTFESVRERPDSLLELDILEAETFIEKQLAEPLTEYTPLPKKLRLALLKVAQFFALVNSDESITKGYKSEKIGDYSYTMGDGTSMSLPDVSDLLEKFAKAEEQPKSGLFLRMRPL